MLSSLSVLPELLYYTKHADHLLNSIASLSSQNKHISLNLSPESDLLVIAHLKYYNLLNHTKKFQNILKAYCKGDLLSALLTLAASALLT